MASASDSLATQRISPVRYSQTYPAQTYLDAQMVGTLHPPGNRRAARPLAPTFPYAAGLRPGCAHCGNWRAACLGTTPGRPDRCPCGSSGNPAAAVAPQGAVAGDHQTHLASCGNHASGDAGAAKQLLSRANPTSAG